MTCTLCPNVALRIIEKSGYCQHHLHEAYEHQARVARYASANNYSMLFDKADRQLRAQREHAEESGWR